MTTKLSLWRVEADNLNAQGLDGWQDVIVIAPDATGAIDAIARDHPDAIIDYDSFTPIFLDTARIVAYQKVDR